MLFAVLISIPAVGWWRFGMNPILGFWLAYVVTRPLGASFADGFSKNYAGGLNIGDPTVALVALAVFVCLVAWVTIKKIDVQPPHELSPHPHHPHPHHDGSHHEPARLGLETD